MGLGGGASLGGVFGGGRKANFDVASIPDRSQLRKTAWYTLSAHVSVAPRFLGIEIS